MKKILVTGADGMLGEAIARVFTDYEVILTDKEELDVRVPLQSFTPKPDLILHLAAETDLEYCQTYPRHAYYTNTIGTINMVELAKALDVPIVYMSTAGIFGGKPAEYYDENSEPCPINVYGRSKYYGELAVRAYPKHWVFRISWAFGGGKRDRKFVMMMYKQLRSGLTQIRAVDDKNGSPSYTMDVAKVIHDYVVGNKPYGVYHIPTGEASRWDVVECMLNILDMRYVHSFPVPSSHFGDYSCTRPKCEVLKSVKGVECRDWKEALEEYLHEIVADKSIT